jgi:hypothetical protein
LLRRFGLHPFSRVLEPRKVPQELMKQAELLQPAGDAEPVRSPEAREDPRAE